MPVRKIYIYGHPVLRLKAQAISEITPEVHELADDMIETMRAADGIGLAGPQVGETRSIVVIDMDLIEEGEEPKASLQSSVRCWFVYPLQTATNCLHDSFWKQVGAWFRGSLEESKF